MKPDEFEAGLRRQTFKSLPPEWRDEILRSAEAGQSDAAAPWWRELLWPNPRAWGAIAAAWVAIAFFNLSGSSHRTGDIAARAAAREVANVWLSLDEQRRLITQFLGERPPAPAPASAKPVKTPSQGWNGRPRTTAV